MSDYIKRLEELAEMMLESDGLMQDVADINEAVSRIKQLERELEQWKESAEHSLVSDENLRDQLAAEKALADRLAAQLKIADAALSDIGDAEREDGDDLQWCEQRAAKAIPATRAELAAYRKARGL